MVWINIVLSGDNVVVMALAVRTLAPRKQVRALAWGSGAVVAMRIALTLFAVALLQLPFLKLIGAVLLLWIGVRLLLPEEADATVDSAEDLPAAIKTILAADLVMSLDNVIAVAAAAGDSVALLVLGLAISIPLVIFGSALLMKAMQRFPVIITAGGALLGFVAGGMAVSDAALGDWMGGSFQMLDKRPMLAGVSLEVIAGLVGAALVVAIGKVLARKHALAARESREVPR